MQDIDRLDNGEGECDENKQHGSCDEAECGDGGMASVTASVMGMVVLVVIIKAFTTTPAEKHGCVYVVRRRRVSMRRAIERGSVHPHVMMCLNSWRPRAIRQAPLLRCGCTREFARLACWPLTKSSASLCAVLSKHSFSDRNGNDHGIATTPTEGIRLLQTANKYVSCKTVSYINVKSSNPRK